jgi:hypothetical protein
LQLGLLDCKVGLRAGDLRRRPLTPGTDLIGKQPRHHLPRLHFRIEVGQDIDDQARELRADQHC